MNVKVVVVGLQEERIRIARMAGKNDRFMFTFYVNIKNTDKIAMSMSRQLLNNLLNGVLH